MTTTPDETPGPPQDQPQAPHAAPAAPQPDQPYAGHPYASRPAAGQAYPGQQYPGPQQPGQQQYPGPQRYPGQQPGQGQQQPGQQQPGLSVPGYGHGAPSGPGPLQRPAKPPVAKVFSTVWLLAAVALVCVLLGLSVPEGGHTAWHDVHAWGVLPVLGAILSAATAYGASSTTVTARRAWQAAVAGAGLLVLYWILLVLPDVGSNTSLLTTLGTAAGVLAVWIAPVPDSAAAAMPRPPEAPAPPRGTSAPNGSDQQGQAW